MEDVLDVYERPLDPKRPVIAFDEKPCQLIADVLAPIQASPNSASKAAQRKRVDCEYQRNGTVNLFGWVEPLTGKRDVWVTDQRTAVDYAHALKRISDAFPEAELIILVQDNLNTHSKASLYAAFEPYEANTLAKRFDFHYTPKHGSWLNVQELEWSALERQALDQCVADKEQLEALVGHWLERRLAAVIKIDWQFTTADARIKLKRLYPQIID